MQPSYVEHININSKANLYSFRNPLTLVEQIAPFLDSGEYVVPPVVLLKSSHATYNRLAKFAGVRGH